MRISELAHATAVPVPTIKYYLREGILPQGESRGATQADYGDEHVQRLRLIRSLIDVAGLPIARIKTVLDLIDHPGDDLFEALGQAIASLPPYTTEDGDADHPRAKAAIERLGWTYDADFAATAQLDRALQAVTDAGIPLSDERLDIYGAALHRLAEFDVAQMPSATPVGGPDTDTDEGGKGEADRGAEGGSSDSGSSDSGSSDNRSSDGADFDSGSSDSTGFYDVGPLEAGLDSAGRSDKADDAPGQASAAIEYAVLGTALYEPVVVAMRRLAHQDVAARLLRQHP
ncbi:MerR family transcriptional regulator [Rathayibacter sp. CAU 1779]